MDNDVCAHHPRCPDWHARDGFGARIRSDQPTQGWCLLCNGLILFDDLSALAPDGRVLSLAGAP